MSQHGTIHWLVGVVVLGLLMWAFTLFVQKKVIGGYLILLLGLLVAFASFIEWPR